MIKKSIVILFFTVVVAATVLACSAKDKEKEKGKNSINPYSETSSGEVYVNFDSNWAD